MAQLTYRKHRGPSVITRRAGMALMGLAIGSGLGGCVERELVIDSQPQGALVYLNDQEIGRTPLRQEFTWYGTYDVVVRKEGFQTLKARTPVNAPAWQWVPIDFIPEVLPVNFKDTHRLNYALKPVSEAAVDPDRIVRRGEAFRERLESGEKPEKTPKGPATRPSNKSHSPSTRPVTGPS